MLKLYEIPQARMPSRIPDSKQRHLDAPKKILDTKKPLPLAVARVAAVCESDRMAKSHSRQRSTNITRVQYTYK